MNTERWTVGVVGSLVAVLTTGCASLEELRQVQMAQRTLEAEKADLEQQLYDARTMLGSLRTRSDSLEQQIGVKDQFIANLTTENDGLEDKFRHAQRILEKVADRPIGQVVMGSGAVPPELDAALRQLAAENPSSVVYDSAHGSLKWTSDLVFGFASDVVKQSAHDSLKRLGEIMTSPAARNFDLVVVGHTDNIPIRRAKTLQKHPSNKHLSVHRAIAVGNFLQDQGLKAARIGVMGFGEYRPLSPNDSDQNRARNRRVEMYIVPAGAFSAGALAMSLTGEDPAASVK